MLPWWEIFDSKMHLLVLVDFQDCQVRPFKGNSWEGWCKRAVEHISTLICVISSIVMIRKRNVLEGALCPFYPCSQHLQHSCYLPPPPTHFLLFPALFILKESACYNHSFFPSLPPPQAVLRQVPAVGQSACTNGCGLKSGQLVSLKMPWTRFFAGPLSGDPYRWVTHHPCASRML